ncbi:stage V sporulation protein AE [Peribacillus deserti]|uniref:Stage V sporulation protein AE n=1 Tax=Peribacillus deserti TaxID=673318 RepID=A0ABS2QJQ3_9BACI|nr:stage V sporulation protein AE [Peribacillus deserti]MBM7693175.1 stage V sporulation protein AE [Peribacillus deserti]
MSEKRKIIIITDGDEYAKRAVERVASEVGGRCISLSYGNPTLLTGPDVLNLIKMAPYDPVLVMFDDSGLIGEGSGETAMKYIASHKDIEVLGLIAVASNTRQNEWTRVDLSIDREGKLTPYGVDKNGVPELEIGRLHGDTVYCIDQLHIPLVVGVGDIGKMAGKDSADIGAPITRKAVELILERSGFNNEQYNTPYIEENMDDFSEI